MKNCAICVVSTFAFLVKVRKLSKKVHFLQLCADLNKKSKTVKAIYINESEFTYILTVLFRQMLWFVGVRATVH